MNNYEIYKTYSGRYSIINKRKKKTIDKNRKFENSNLGEIQSWLNKFSQIENIQDDEIVKKIIERYENEYGKEDEEDLLEGIDDIKEKVIIDILDGKEEVEKQMRAFVREKGFNYKMVNGCFIMVGQLLENYGEDFEFINGNMIVINANVEFEKDGEYPKERKDHWYLTDTDDGEIYDISIEQFFENGVIEKGQEHNGRLGLNSKEFNVKYSDLEDEDFIVKYTIEEFIEIYKNSGISEEIIDKYRIKDEVKRNSYLGRIGETGHRTFKFDEDKINLYKARIEDYVINHKDYLFQVGGAFGVDNWFGNYLIKHGVDYVLHIPMGNHDLLKRNIKDVSFDEFGECVKEQLEYDEFSYENIKEYYSVFYNAKEIKMYNGMLERNRGIVDNSDILVCVLDKSQKRSGTEHTVNYAIKKGIEEITNLF